jgi:hypothetical protein
VGVHGRLVDKIERVERLDRRDVFRLDEVEHPDVCAIIVH